MTLPPPPPTLPTPAPVVNRVLASLVQVHVPQAGGREERLGSGVVVAPGVVATNAHVLGEPGSALRATISAGTGRWTATRIQVDPELDICLLRVPGLLLPPAPVCPEPPSVGATIFAAGFPGGRGPKVSFGRIRAVWHYRTRFLLQVDVETHPGSSGGGLFDQQGRLIGLTTFTEGGSSRMSFALDADAIMALERQPEQPGSPGLRVAPGSDEVLREAAEDPRNWPAWEPSARQWTEVAPRDPDAWCALGLALEQRAQREGAPELVTQAVEAFRHALRLRPDALVWNNLGVSLDAQNRFDEAGQAFREAIRLRPDYGLAWLNLGSTQFNAKDFKEAADAYRRGLALRPDEADGWVRLARCLRALGDGPAEAAAFEIALRYRPLDMDGWLELGLAHAQLGHRAEAQAILQRLRSHAPALVEPLARALRTPLHRR
jgi:Tfp pilus assembly protein PilF